MHSSIPVCVCAIDWLWLCLQLTLILPKCNMLSHAAIFLMPNSPPATLSLPLMIMFVVIIVGVWRESSGSGVDATGLCLPKHQDEIKKKKPSIHGDGWVFSGRKQQQGAAL